MKKVNFPRATLPAIVGGACLFNNIMLLLSIIGVIIILGHPINFAVLWLIPLIFLTFFVAISIGLILAIINVFIRDVGYLMLILLQIWFWFTPIVYPETIIPDSYRSLLNLNPIYPLVKAYQQVLVYGQTPQFKSLLILVMISLILNLSGLLLFKRASAEIVDVL